MSNSSCDEKYTFFISVVILLAWVLGFFYYNLSWLIRIFVFLGLSIVIVALTPFRPDK